MKARLIKSGILIGVVLTFFASCSKLSDSPAFSDDEIMLAKDDISADEIILDIDASVQEKIDELEEAGYQPVAEKSAADDFVCLEVTVDYPDSTRFPKVITFDYGTGCTAILKGDTITMEGKIIVTLTAPPCEEGSQKIMTFEDLFVNDMQVEGVLTNTFVGLNENNYLEFNMLLEGGKLTFADDEGNVLEYTRDADFTKQWDREHRRIEDTIYLDGSMWGVNAEGLDYSREIIESLVLVHCPGYGRRWVIVDGQVESIVDGVSTLTDYSDGGCDGTANVVQGNRFLQVRIRHNHRHRHQHQGGH